MAVHSADSSSSSLQRPWNYDVFLSFTPSSSFQRSWFYDDTHEIFTPSSSFRRPRFYDDTHEIFTPSSSFRHPWFYDDTHENFTDHLYRAFCQKGISIFMNKKIGKWEPLTGVIEHVRISLVIFSQYYAHSTRSLEELVRILELRHEKGQLVIPLFYKVDPRTVGYQRESFKEALDRHKLEFQHDSDTVLRWRLALHHASNLFGWVIEKGDEFEYIQKITEEVISRLKSSSLDANNLRSTVSGDRWTNSSSSSFQHPRKYDVYFSFRGKDTRRNFTAHLYKAMCNKGIDAFIDSMVEPGEEIRSALLRASEQSRISIIIFSEHYAFSSWCLDELVHIMNNREQRGQMVIPVFYKVDPSDVRHLRASFGYALAKHRSRFGDDSERVQRYRLALGNLANTAGWHLEHG